MQILGLLTVLSCVLVAAEAHADLWLHTRLLSLHNRHVCRDLHAYVCPSRDELFLEQVRKQLIIDSLTKLAATENNVLERLLKLMNVERNYIRVTRLGEGYGSRAATEPLKSELSIHHQRGDDHDILQIKVRGSSGSTRQHRCQYKNCPLFYKAITKGYLQELGHLTDDIRLVLVVDENVMPTELTYPVIYDKEEAVMYLLAHTEHPFYSYFNMLIIKAFDEMTYTDKDILTELQTIESTVIDELMKTILDKVPAADYTLIHAEVNKLEHKSLLEPEAEELLQNYFEYLEDLLDLKDSYEEEEVPAHVLHVANQLQYAMNKFATSAYFPLGIVFHWITDPENAQKSIIESAWWDLPHKGFTYPSVIRAFQKARSPDGFRYGFLGTIMAKDIVVDINWALRHAISEYSQLEEDQQSANATAMDSTEDLLEQVNNLNKVQNIDKTDGPFLPLCDAEIAQIVFNHFQDNSDYARYLIPRAKRFLETPISTFNDREWFFVGLASKFCMHHDIDTSIDAIMSLRHQLGSFNRVFQCEADDERTSWPRDGQCGRVLEDTFLQ